MLSKEEIEKAKEIMNKFTDNEMQRDKLEIDNRCGGWKIGDVYKHLELNPAIETLLQYIQELEEENVYLKEWNDKYKEELAEKNKKARNVLSKIKGIKTSDLINVGEQEILNEIEKFFIKE